MTPFEEIYQLFAQKITDYKLLDLSDEILASMLLGWLKSAIANTKRLENDLEDINLEELCFNSNLNNTEKEVLALGMVIEWLRPQTNSVLLTSQFVSGSEEKSFSQSKHLSELRTLSEESRINKRRLISDYFVQHNTYLEK